MAEVALPQFKGRPGWEFTDLTGFSLDAFAAVTAGEGDPGAVHRVETLASWPTSTSSSPMRIVGYVSERESSSSRSASQTTVDFEPVAPLATSSRPR